MPRQELVPGALAAPRARLETGGFQDLFDCVSRRRLDPQLLELAHNPGVAPGILLRHQQDQLANVGGGLRSAATSRPSLAGFRLLPDPAEEGVRGYDRHDLVNGGAQISTEPEQSIPLFPGHADPLWQPRAEDRFSSFR